MNASSLKKLTAGAAMAGLLAVGGATVAGAATSERPAACDRAPEVQERVIAAHERAHASYDDLVAARDRAEAAGKTKTVERIDQRLDRIRDRHATLHERYEAAKAKVKERCGVDLAPLPADELG